MKRLALLFCLTSAFAAPADPWLHIRTANFELYTDGNERAGRDLIRHFEQVRSFFLQVFGLKSTDGKPVCLIAFRNEKEFRPYRPSEAATAFYHPGGRRDFILMSSTDAADYQIATHEYTHLLIGQMSGVVPIWLNEGLAELYSTFRQDGAQVFIGDPPPGRAASLLSDRWVDLASLLAVTPNSPLYNERSRASMFYAESWALVHMLNLDQQYRQHLAAFLDSLRTLDSAAALQSAYGKSVAQVEADLQAYLQRQVLRGLAVKLTLSDDADSPAIEPQSAVGARIALAELLSDYPGKIGEAAGAYAKLAHDFPQRWEVEAAWGQFAWRERRNQEASAHFARAANLGATDPGLFVDYARALSSANRVDEAVAALRKAIGFDTSSREPHYELGLLLAKKENWSGAIAELKLSRPIKPQWAPRYFYSMALSEERLGDAIAARNYVDQGRAYTKIPDESAKLDALSQRLGPPVVEGVLQSVDCQGKLASLHVRIGESAHVFLIPDVTAAKDLACGAQKDIPVRIEFQGMPLGVEGADGIVRKLEFR